MSIQEFWGLVMNGFAKDVAKKLNCTRRTARKLKQHHQKLNNWGEAVRKTMEKNCVVV